jgi:hypothetical protein
MKLRKLKKEQTRKMAELEAQLARRAEEIRALRERDAAFRARTEKLLQDTQKSLRAITDNNHRMLVGILQERIEVFLARET